MVADNKWNTLETAVAALAGDAVRVQKVLDAGVAAQREKFAATLSALPESARDALMPLAPTQLVLREHEVTVSLRASVSRSFGFAFYVSPINAGYSALYGATETEQSKLTVLCRAVPVQPGKSPHKKGA